MSRIRLGIIGLGGMGTVHTQNALQLETAHLVAVASTRRERAAEAARELGVRALTYEELLAADDVDAVVVAARSIDHARWGSAALVAGKHLFLEKPGATSLAGHDVLAAAAAARPGAVVQVG
ncbi:MAG: Gfo/Idh/MocA family oxidoreductase, partial [Gaiellaceae bacterium]